MVYSRTLKEKYRKLNCWAVVLPQAALPPTGPQAYHTPPDKGILWASPWKGGGSWYSCGSREHLWSACENTTRQAPYFPSNLRFCWPLSFPPLHLFVKEEGASGPGSRGHPGSWLSRTVDGLGVGTGPLSSRDPLPLLTGAQIAAALVIVRMSPS